MATAPQDAKKALRKQIKSRLAALSEWEIERQSQKAQELILELPQFKAAKRVGVYLSMPTAEATTDLIVNRCLIKGKDVFVPHTYSLFPDTTVASVRRHKVMDMLRLESFVDKCDMERDAWGIRKFSDELVPKLENALGGVGLSLTEIETEDQRDDGSGGLDLIIVPGVAFDTQMSRLGHGAGFYDRYLTRYCEGGKREKPFLVGLCLAEQIVPDGEIKMEMWDWRVDAVAVGDGTFLTKDAAATA